MNRLNTQSRPAPPRRPMSPKPWPNSGERRCPPSVFKPYQRPLGVDLFASLSVQNGKPLPPSVNLKLLRAATSGDMDGVKACLADSNVSINYQDTQGNTPLMLAVDRGHFDIVQLLLSNQANANLPNRDDTTPLIKAVLTKQPKMVDALLNAGVDAHYINLHTDSALSLAMEIDQHDIANQIRRQMGPEPAKNEVIRDIKTLSVLFSVKGMLPLEGKNYTLEGANSEYVVKKFVDTLGRYRDQVANDPETKRLLNKAIANYAFTYKMQTQKNWPGLLKEHVRTHDVTVIDTGWSDGSGHAVYSTIYNNHKNMPGIVYAISNRGYASESHQWYNMMRLNSTLPFNADVLKNDQTLDQLIQLLQRHKPSDLRTGEYILYTEIPKLLGNTKINDPLTVTPQKTQTVGNCPGTSLKASLRLFFQVDSGNAKMGEVLFKDVASFIKVDRFIETMKSIDTYLEKTPNGDRNLYEKMTKLYLRKFHNRIEKKHDPVIFNYLQSGYQSLASDPRHAQSAIHVKRLIDSLSQ